MIGFPTRILSRSKNKFILKRLRAFIRLIRWQNLVFIAITQALFAYCIITPVYEAAARTPIVKGNTLLLLILASILIAAAGYIINDYFDLNIDVINKPDKVIIGKRITRRWAIAFHLILSVFGITIGIYLDFTTKILLLSVANLTCVLLLFAYSISLKKRLLVGNILISLLTAWTVLVITWCETRNLLSPLGVSRIKITRYTLLYAGFAFIISLIREVIKDIEDMEGDRRYGCKTMPIVWGVNASKIFIAVWLVVLLALLLSLQFYVLQFHWWFSALYSVVFIIAPLINIFRKLFTATTSEDYHQLSGRTKMVMLTGILSMIFIKFYS